VQTKWGGEREPGRVARFCPVGVRASGKESAMESLAERGKRGGRSRTKVQTERQTVTNVMAKSEEKKEPKEKRAEWSGGQKVFRRESCTTELEIWQGAISAKWKSR